MTFLPNVLLFWVNNVVFCDREAEDCALYLGEELKGEPGVNVEAVGDSRVDGSTRALVTRQREGLRARVLSKAKVQGPCGAPQPGGPAHLGVPSAGQDGLWLAPGHSLP